MKTGKIVVLKKYTEIFTQLHHPRNPMTATTTKCFFLKFNFKESSALRI
jgi:hypothetical protein